MYYTMSRLLFYFAYTPNFVCAFLAQVSYSDVRRLLSDVNFSFK